MFNNADQIFGVLSTFSGTKHPCSLDNPCDVDSPLEVPATPIVYGPSVIGLQKCFPAGRFDLNADGCILPRPPIPSLTRGVGRYTRAWVNGAPPQWNVQVGKGELPYYRFKAGPVGNTQCHVDTGYSSVMSVATDPLITAEIAPTLGVYVLCVHGGTGTDISTFTPLNSAAQLIAEVDEAPPTLPLPRDDRTDSVTFKSEYPDYVKYHYRVQGRGQSDCSLRPDDGVITDYGVVKIGWSLEICVTAEDAVGNLSEPDIISIANP
jgi:hypothetical protein